MVMSVVGPNGLEERYRKTSSTGPRGGVLDEDGPVRPVQSVRELDGKVVVVSGDEIWQVIGDWESWHLLTTVRCQEEASGRVESAAILDVSFSNSFLWGVTRACGVFVVGDLVSVTSRTVSSDSLVRHFNHVVGLRDGFLNSTGLSWFHLTDAGSWELVVDEPSLLPAPDGRVWVPVVDDASDGSQHWLRFESVLEEPSVEAFRPPVGFAAGSHGWAIGWDGKWYMYGTGRWRPQVWEVGPDSVRRVGEVIGGDQRIRLYAGRPMLAISRDGSFKLRGDEFRETEFTYSEASVSFSGEVAATDGERVFILGRKRDRATDLVPGNGNIEKLQYDGCGRLWSFGDRIHVQRGRSWVEVAPGLTASWGQEWASAGPMATGVVVADRTKIVTIEMPCW